MTNEDKPNLVGKPSRKGRFLVNHDPNFVTQYDLALPDGNSSRSTGPKNAQITTKERTRAVNEKNRRFEMCDFNHFDMSDSSFTDCEFVGCYFRKASFEGVKFSKCTFKRCDFLHVSLENCQFIDCKFEEIQVSAEHFKLTNTRIPTSHFIHALTTNLSTYDEERRPYQKHRFILSRATLTSRFLASSFALMEDDLISDAFMVHQRSLYRAKIEGAKWKRNDSEFRLEKGNIWERAYAGLLRAEWVLIYCSGMLTNWGKTLVFALLAMLGVVIGFTAMYVYFEETLGEAIVRALDCSLVFGYTRHGLDWKEPTLTYLTTINALIGLVWYALWVPSLLRKTLYR